MLKDGMRVELHNQVHGPRGRERGARIQLGHVLDTALTCRLRVHTSLFSCSHDVDSTSWAQRVATCLIPTRLRWLKIGMCPVPKSVTHRTFCTLSTTLAAERRSTFTTFVKRWLAKTIPLDGETSDTVDNIQIKIQVKQGTLPDQQQLTLSGNQLEDERMIFSVCDIIQGPHGTSAGDSLVVLQCRQRESTSAFSVVSEQLQQV